jgi:hypothetical protein
MSRKETSRKGKEIFVLLLAVLSLGACDKQVTDFVKASRPDNTIDHPGEIARGRNGLKVSPGSAFVKGANASADTTVTPTNRFLKSSGVSATVSISQSRSSVQ